MINKDNSEEKAIKLARNKLQIINEVAGKIGIAFKLIIHWGEFKRSAGSKLRVSNTTRRNTIALMPVDSWLNEEQKDELAKLLQADARTRKIFTDKTGNFNFQENKHLATFSSSN